MRYLILLVVAVYAYLVVDGLEGRNDAMAVKKPYRARFAVFLLAAVTAIFAQSANSLENKLEDSQSQLVAAQQQNSQLNNQVNSLQTENARLQDRLSIALASSQLSLPSISSSGNGATAKCMDGTLSYAANHRGACSHHGGVAEWYR